MKKCKKPKIGERHIARLRGAFLGGQKSKGTTGPKTPVRCTLAHLR
jgi:hypothetical protein